MSILGERIRIKRRELDITQEELANRLHSSQSQIWKYESGVSTPNADALISLARELKTSPDWLLGWQDDDDPQNIKLEPEEIALIIQYRSKSDSVNDQILSIVKAV